MHKLMCDIYVSNYIFAVLAPIIDKGEPEDSITEFPPYLSEGNRTFQVGGNDFVLVGYSFTVTCNILQGIPPPTIMWFKDGGKISNFNLLSLTVFVKKSYPRDAAGRYACMASNVAGLDSGESVMRLGEGEYCGHHVPAVACT